MCCHHIEVRNHPSTPEQPSNNSKKNPGIIEFIERIMFWFRLHFLLLVAIKNVQGQRPMAKAAYWLANKMRVPEAAFGFFHLNASYQEAVAPKMAAAMCQMEPVFVMAIDSLTRKMGIEIKLTFVWEDPGITWKRGDLMTAGSRYSFDHSVLK